jgi:hypothetical protein
MGLDELMKHPLELKQECVEKRHKLREEHEQRTREREQKYLFEYNKLHNMLITAIEAGNEDIVALIEMKIEVLDFMNDK